MKNNIPPLIEQYKENMMRGETPSIQFNYYQTMLNIRDYCDKALKEYERKGKKVRV